VVFSYIEYKINIRDAEIFFAVHSTCASTEHIIVVISKNLSFTKNIFLLFFEEKYEKNIKNYFEEDKCTGINFMHDIVVI